MPKSVADLEAWFGIVNQFSFAFSKVSLQQFADFAGFISNKTEFRPPKYMIKAFNHFPMPKSVTDVEAWFGIVKQVSYAFSECEFVVVY